MTEANRLRDLGEEAALSAASKTLRAPQKSFLERHRGKLGLALGVVAGLYAGYIKWGNQQEEITPRVRAQVAGVLLCGPEGCMAIRPEEMAELGDGCEEPGSAEPPPEFSGELPELVMPPECFEGIPQNFPGNAPKLEIPAPVVEL